MERLGIDIGSKTIKLVVLDESGKLVYQSYVRHFSKVKDKLIAGLNDCLWKYGDHEVALTVTGSAGLRVAELFEVPFVQEVVALKRAVEKKVPGCDAILEMGGEDTKLVYLTGVPEQRMNNVCAGGTGGFIDMMAGLMGMRNEDMQGLAEKATTIYPIASRCAVFAKSDVRPLLNAGAKKEDIAASVLEAVCTQAVAGLSAGRPLAGTVALLGGPFHYIPALRDAFCRVTGIDDAHAIVPDNAHLFVAYGAATSPEHSDALMLSELIERLEASDFSSQEELRRLPPLFERQEDYLEFRRAHATARLPRRHLIESSENLFLGIDAGSTTMKMALIDETGALV
ncbi:MAG: BadF/BadG/BcrA/BcrD ATPase family protein, partial [Coriobacteriales bacterium]